MASQTVVDVPTFALLGPWAAKGACHTCDPGINFFPERGEDARPAKRVCRGCPVIAACLEDALEDFDRVGIWGGKSGKERRRIRRQRALTAGVPADLMQCSRCLVAKPTADMTPAAVRGGLCWCRACKQVFDHGQYLKRLARQAGA